MIGRRPIGWVLPCHDPVLGLWFDFRDGPTAPAEPGWLPVVPQVDPLLEGMATVLWDNVNGMWDARAQGCTAWAKAATVWDAVGLAAQLAATPEEEIELW